MEDGVRSWFARRTWHHGAWGAAGVARDLEERGIGVSVVIPALNEAATVGAVAAMASRLATAGVVTEVVVVDGGSADLTARRAAEAGARVIDQRAGGGVGKGDALWQGLAATRGELVVFLDADLRRPDERYVVGLVGPLLADPEVCFVKACYDRAPGGAGAPTAGGGRVTELVARPLLAAFWPELAGLAQPLAGEYAARRDVLEAVGFPTGYGVEFGLLVDVAARYGVDAVGQVDLGRREHTPQDLSALGRMAAEVLAVAAARLRAEGRLDAVPTGWLPRPRRGAGGALEVEFVDVPSGERPPLRTWRDAADGGPP